MLVQSCIVWLLLAPLVLAEEAWKEGLLLVQDRQSSREELHAIGDDRAERLLTAVISHIDANTAARPDWVYLHRAADALIELETMRGNALKASVYASLQDGYYRTLDQDYAAALRASRRALDLHRTSGATATLPLSLAAVARNLRSTGQPRQAAGLYLEAMALENKPEIVLDLIHAYLDDHDPAAARAQLGRITRPDVASLGASDIAAASRDFDEATARLIDARAAGASSIDLMARALSLVLDGVQTLSRADAGALVGKLKTSFPESPIDAFSQPLLRHRRLIAGDIEGILREQTAAVDAARVRTDRRGEAQALLGLATAYRGAAGLRQALGALQQSMELDPQWLTGNLIGETAFELNDFPLARKSFDGVLRGIAALPAAAERAAAPQRLRAQLGEALLAARDDDPDTAREIYRRHMEHDPAQVSLEFARLERAERSFAAARDLYQRSLAACEAAMQHLLALAVRLELLHFLATEAAALPGSVPAARAHLEIACAEAVWLESANGLWRCDYERGILAEQSGARAEAQRHFAATTARLDAAARALTLDEQRHAFSDAPAMQDLARRTLALSVESNESESWEQLERFKARAFRDELPRRGAAAKNAPAADVDRLAAAIDGLRTVATESNQAVLRAAGREPAMLRIELRGLESRLALALNQSKLLQTREGQSNATASVTLARIRQLLPARTALVEFGAVNDGFVAFVVTNEQVRSARILLPPSAAMQSIRQLRQLLASPGSQEDLAPVITRLSRDLWNPVAALIPPAISHLTIVPAESLAYLPFAVLESSGRPLIERYSISYLPNASILEVLPKSAPNPAAGLFLGALGNLALEGMPGLPGTLAETNAIAALYPSAKRASGNQFTHQTVRNALMTEPAVHLATHGLAEPAPQFSALLTSPAPGQPARFSLYELSNLSVRSRLVVLSACETGLGQLTRGDEVLGFNRAFLLAGADTVVSSLWKVSDEGTAPLMREFYSRMRSGASPAAALRDAMLLVRKKLSHPFYWAPFIVTGAP